MNQEKLERCAEEIHNTLFEDGGRAGLRALDLNQIQEIIRRHVDGETGFILKSNVRCVRRDDMSAHDTLSVMMQPDGDLIVQIFKQAEYKDEATFAHVEFCACGAGGGRSPRTREALRALAEAIALDNRESPRAKGNRDESAVCFERTEAPQ